MKRGIKRAMMVGLLALLAAGLPVMSQVHRGPPPPPLPPPGHPPGPPGPPGPLEPALGPAGRALFELDLTESQRTRVDGVVRGSMDGDLGALVRAFEEARHALEVEIWDAAVDSQQVLEASRSLAARAEQVAVARHRMVLEVLGVLSEEQRGELRTILERAPHGPPPPPPPPGGPFGREGHGR